MPKNTVLLVIEAGLLLALSGCAVGPDYQAPKHDPAEPFISAGASGVNANSPTADLATFWRGFQDPVLTELVDQAIAANFDVLIAQERFQAARAMLGGATADQFPEIDGVGSAARALQPGYLVPGTTSRGDRTANAFDSHFVANWELDFFGRKRRMVESAAAQVSAAEAGVHAAQTVAVAEVARTYLEVRGLQLRYAIAERSLRNQQQVLELTNARFNAGRGTRLDVVRATSFYRITESTLPAIQAAIERAAFRIATLTAMSPRAALQKLLSPKALPNLPVTDLGELPLGTPEQMLRRRPDVKVAERDLASATADIGVATADLFPRISLTGLIGFGANRASQFGDRASQEYSVGAGLAWPLLDFGRVRSRIRANQAGAREALARYERTVATALEETEGSLSQFSRTAYQVELLVSASRNAEEATQLSKQRFNAGAVDLLIVLDAERQSLTSEDSLVQAQVVQAIALINVYRALGGGWTLAALKPS